MRISGLSQSKNNPFWFQACLAFLPVFLFALAACQSPLPPPPIIPTAELWQIESVPGLAWLGPIFNKCTVQLLGIALDTTELPASLLDTTKSIFTFRWGAPGSLTGFAAQIGQEDLVVIVHPSNPYSAISLSDLQQIYSGPHKSWSELVSDCPNCVRPQGKLEAWVYAPDDDVQQIFNLSLFNGLSLRSDAWLAPGPEAVRQMIAAHPTAIGFVPARWVDSSVKILSITGASAERLRQPILAVSATEPQGMQRTWLKCIQDGIEK